MCKKLDFLKTLICVFMSTILMFVALGCNSKPQTNDDL